MTTLILDRADLEIRRDGKALALYENGERTGTIPLNLLERVVIQGNVHLDTAVLVRLAEAGIGTVLLSARHGRQAAIILGGGHADASVRIAQCQLAFDESWCNRWAVHIVRRKVRAQLGLLRKALDERPDNRKILFDAIGALEGMQVALGAEEGMRMASARGVEGAAAATFFKAFTTLFADSLEFTGRNRRPPRDPVNACLSLGYTMLHFDAVRALHAAGLDPLVGFLHRPTFGRESMACDIVEPLRSMVDEWVWSLFRTRMLRTENFSYDKGAVLLNKSGREKFYAMFEGLARELRRRLRRDAAMLARVMRGKGDPLMAPIESADGDWS